MSERHIFRVKVTAVPAWQALDDFEDVRVDQGHIMLGDRLVL